MLRGLFGWVPIVLGVLLGVGITLAVVRATPTTSGDPPGALGGPPLAEATGKLARVLIHFPPQLEPILTDPYTDLLGSLPPQTRLVVIVPDEARAETELHRFLDSIAPSLWARTQVVTVPSPITPWSKDRALVLGPADDGTPPTLLVPPPPPSNWPGRVHDWEAVEAFVRSTSGAYVRHEIPLAFDAGDFAVTPDRVIVDVNLFAKNRDRHLGSPRELAQVLTPLLGRPVLVLGAREGDVPRHHLSMYMTPLGSRDGREVVLVGDPSLAESVVGHDFVPGERDPDTGEPLRADFSLTMQRRHDRAARQLAAAGFRVVRIPTVPLLDKTYMTYTNGVYSSADDHRIAWVPTYGIPSLDSRAQRIYEELGWQVHPVRVRSVYAMHGTIGCLVNVLDRSPAPNAR